METLFHSGRPRQSIRRHAMWIAICVILWLAFAFRVNGIQTRPLWYDESFAVLLAEHDIPAIAAGTAADTMPPLFYLLLHYWRSVGGDSAFAMRMLTVSLSILVVALTFAIAALAWNRRAGLWAALFASLAPFQVYHAQELRMYSLLSLAVMLYLYGFLRWRAGLRWGLPIVTLGTALSLYTHNLAAFTLVAADVYLLWKREARDLVTLAAAQAAGALAFLPWIFLVPSQVAKIQNAFWTQPPGVADLIQILVVFTTYLPVPAPLLPVVLFVSLAVFVLAVVDLARLVRRRIRPALTTLLAFALVPPFLLLVISYLMRPVLVPRGLIGTSLVYYVVLGVLSAEVTPRMQWSSGIVAGVVAFACLPLLYSGWGEWRRAPFSDADTFLRLRVQPGDLILHDNKLSFFSMYLYNRTLPQAFLADPPGSDNDTLAVGSQAALGLYPSDFETVLRGRPRVWFVIFQTAVAQAVAESHPHGNLSRLESGFHRSDSSNFGDLDVMLYEAR